MTDTENPLLREVFFWALKLNDNRNVFKIINNRDLRTKLQYVAYTKHQ